MHGLHHWHPWGAAATCTRRRERWQRWRAPGRRRWSGDVLARLSPAYRAPSRGGACGAGAAAVPRCRPGRSPGQGPARGYSGRLNLSLRARPPIRHVCYCRRGMQSHCRGRICSTGEGAAEAAGYSMLGCPTGAERLAVAAASSALASDACRQASACRALYSRLHVPRLWEGLRAPCGNCGRGAPARSSMVLTSWGPSSPALSAAPATAGAAPVVSSGSSKNTGDSRLVWRLDGGGCRCCTSQCPAASDGA